MKIMFSTLGPAIALAGLATFFSTLSAEELPPLPKVKHMIDTHIHIYDTNRKEGVPWPRPDDTVIYKPHLPEEFKKVSKPSGLTGVIVVEASDRLEDNDWVLDLVEGDDFFVGLVGRVDPYREDFEEQIVRLKKDPRFVGIRTRGKKGEEAVDFSNPKLLKSYRTLAKHQLTADILAGNGGVAVVEQIDYLARQVPDLHIVINHLCGYRIDGSPADPAWIKAIEKLAENNNVWCKVSGLYQRSIPQPAPRDINHYRNVLDVLWDNLGENRLIFGTNWPCTKRVGDYDGFVRLVNSYFVEKGPEASERYFWKNASEAYRLKLR